ncbi:MAG: hypothetical protein K0Q87_3284, partial [Neobacillus sp.]|nr:hypothetical protein [Neobacillus sp.]
MDEDLELYMEMAQDYDEGIRCAMP